MNLLELGTQWHTFGLLSAGGIRYDEPRTPVVDLLRESRPKPPVPLDP